MTIPFKRIAVPLATLVFAGAVVAGATGAFFSDTEVSTGNTFTAGAIDLKVDSKQHYNGHVCIPNTGTQTPDAPPYVWGPGGNSYPVTGTACGGTWGQTAGLDIVNEKFFNFGDIKPGDEGENTISLHVVNNDAWLCAAVSDLASDDNSQTEPETIAPLDTDDMASGELDDQMVWKIWRDDGDNIQEVGEDAVDSTVDETTMISGNPTNGILPLHDSTTGGPIPGGSTRYLGVSWTLPSTSGNETQTDSLTGNIRFWTEQARNNPGFRCIPTTTPTT